MYKDCNITFEGAGRNVFLIDFIATKSMTRRSWYSFFFVTSVAIAMNSDTSKYEMKYLL